MSAVTKQILNPNTEALAGLFEIFESHKLKNMSTITKQNFISVDRQTAISSYGEVFSVGEVVGHEDENTGEATIESFTLMVSENEIRVETDKGFAHLDFIVKLKNDGE